MGSPLGDVPIFIAMMHPNGVAAQTQKLRVSFANSNSSLKIFSRVFYNFEFSHISQGKSKYIFKLANQDTAGLL